MITNESVTRAYSRLLDRFGTREQKTDPARRPSETALITSAINEATNSPDGDTTGLRAALELTAKDQQHAQDREANVVALLRQRGVPWHEIAFHRGLGSAQAAEQRYRRIGMPPQTMIYAFRAAGDPDEAWHGDPDALPAGQFDTGYIDFAPGIPRPYSGHRLEIRYGPVDLDVEPGYLRAYTRVNGRQVATAREVQHELFGA